MAPRHLHVLLTVFLASCGGTDASPDASSDATVPDASRERDAATEPDAARERDAATERDASRERDAATEQDAATESWCTSDATELGRVASALAPGEWGELPVDPSLPALALHPHLTTWSDTGVWNPVRRRVQWVGSPGSCCADPARYDLILYDVATNTWSRETTPWPDDAGHAYDGNAIDPDTGIHYFARSSNVQRFDGSGWTRLPSPGPQTVAVGLTWFRSRRELVLLGSRISRWDGASWTEVPMEGVTFGSYHTFAEYNPVHDVVWLGGGNGGDTRSAVLRADGTVTQLADAPVRLSSSGVSMKTYDPVTGLYVVESADEDRWFTFDVVADVWTEITDRVRAARSDRWLRTARDFVTPIDDCGVLLYFQATAAPEYRLHVYRHAR